MSLEVPKVEYIPNSHYVLRNVHCAQVNRWVAKRIPNETDFILRQGEDGLSVNWEQYCSLQQVFILIGSQKNKKQEFLKPQEFKVIKFNVGELRNLNLLVDCDLNVVHNPVKGNYAHSLVSYKDDVELRLKLCDIVSSMQTPLLSINFEEIAGELESKRKEIG